MPKESDKDADEFAETIDEWRRKYHLREDEPLLLCLELFRIHQDHWDKIRRNELPSFSDFQDSLVRLQQEANDLQRQIAILVEALARQPKPSRFISPTLGGLLLTALFATFTGILIGRYIF